MAKLKNLSINMAPKLDLRKTQKLSQKIVEIFDKSLGNLANIGSKSAKAIANANQGLQVLDQLKSILHVNNGIIEDLISNSDLLTHSNTMRKQYAEKMHSLFSMLNTDSLPENFQELYQAFLTKMREQNSARLTDNAQNISEIHDNTQNRAGLTDNDRKSVSMQSFVNIIHELQELKNIIHSQASQAQKNNAQKNNASMIEKYFGQEKIQELDNFIIAMQNIDNTMKRNTENNQTESVSNNDNVFAVQQGLAILEEQKKHNTLLSVKSAETVQMQSSMNYMEYMIKMLMSESATFMHQFHKGFNVMLNMIQNMSKMITDIMHFLSLHKSPIEESFQKDLHHLFHKRDALLSKMDKRNPLYNDKDKQGDQKSLDDLYAKFKRIFEYDNTDSTKYAADENTLRRIITDKNYRGNA